MPRSRRCIGRFRACNGAVKFGSGVVKALNASSDAEAKDMWEQVGEGGLTVAASAFGMKASYGAMKTAAAKSANGSALSSLTKEGTFAQRAVEFAKAFGKDAYRSSKYNLKTFGSTVSSTLKYKTSQRKLDAMENPYADKNASKILNDLKEAKAEYYSNRVKGSEIDKVFDNASKTKEIIRHPFKALKKGNAETPKVDFKLSESIKNIPSNLSKKGVEIWKALTNNESTYAHLIQKYGYSNVADVLEVMSEYGIVDNQI